MNVRDYNGRRGETVFPYLIGKLCSGRFWCHCTFAGEKAEAKDFIVNLIEPSCGEATLFVQVKSNMGVYSGKGATRKLKVTVTAKDMAKLKQVPGPTYVAGIDVVEEVGYLYTITEKTGTSLSGVPCTHKIDCPLIENLWKEVEAYWSKRNMLAKRSLFS